MRFIGRREGIESELVERMEWAEELTEAQRPDHGSSWPSTTAGGPRSSMPRAASRARERRSSARHLYAPEMHDPDLLIRTSGELRVSNYLLWQCAYAELVFRDELWPDFTREAFEAVAGRSSRTAGGVSAPR